MSQSGRYGFILILLLCFSSSLVGGQGITDPTEVAALKAIRKSLKDPFNNLANWNKGDPCTSNWTGVLCYNVTLSDGYLHVEHLQMLNQSLSGTLSPELGSLSQLKILDFMWNNITGSIPKEIGNIQTLELLVVNGNQLSGSLPEEIGYLPELNRIQIDQNQISGPIPTSFANLNKTKHFHMNNNSISGQIPAELSRLPNLVHFLLDNNNLTGHLPPEFSQLQSLLILQLDNNQFDGSTIPESYGNISTLLKLSLRNCSLQGPIPDFSSIPNLGYLDLSSNQLTGLIPQNKLSDNITTIDLSYNILTGTIPESFSDLPRLQKLTLANNSLNGSVPATIWQNRTFTTNQTLVLDLQNNQLSNVSGSLSYPQNVTVWLRGNPLCSSSNLIQFCGIPSDVENNVQISLNSTEDCKVQSCPSSYEYAPNSPVSCFCAAPLLVGYRLKSPGFSSFPPFKQTFEEYLTTGMSINIYQLYIDSFSWQKGPRLRMELKFFPVYNANISNNGVFNSSELQRIVSMFTGWNVPDSELFGPYELLNFTFLGPYKDGLL